MRNVTIGQYYPAASIIHRLDPRVKLMATFGYITVVFLFSHFWSYAVAAMFLAGIIKLSNVPPVFLFRGLRSIVFILLFTVVLNIFFAPGSTVLFEAGFIMLTQEGLLLAARMGTRLVLLVVGSSVLTLTTSPIALTSAIEYVLKPLKKIGIPAHEIAMMMTIALRFIPTLIEEMDKIMKAQMARGADFDTGGLYKKAKGMIPLLVPLFVSAFRRADDLALAMEARCYRGDVNRTSMKKLTMGRQDYIAIAVLIVFATVAFAAGYSQGILKP